MRHIISTFIAFGALVAFVSCNEQSENNTSSEAINRAKSILQENRQKESDYFIETANNKTAFYQSINDLNDDEFRKIYPLIKEWKGEGREISREEVAKINEKKEAVNERKESLLKSIENRIRVIEEDI